MKATQKDGEDVLERTAQALGHTILYNQNGESLVVATCTQCHRHGFVERKPGLKIWNVWGQVTEVKCDGGICELTYREEKNA